MSFANQVQKPSATMSKTIFQAAGNRPDVFFGMHLVHNAVADIMALKIGASLHRNPFKNPALWVKRPEEFVWKKSRNMTNWKAGDTREITTTH